MRANRRRKEDREAKKETEGGGTPGWMVTYGDLMTLILTFFVLLISFSSIQISEFQKALGSLKGALGVLKFKQSVSKSVKINTPQYNSFNQQQTMEKLEEMEAYIKKQGLEDHVKVNVTDDGIGIRIMEKVMFDLGKAELKPSIYPILDKIASLIRGWQNKVRIEGHTDNLPISTAEFPSNWELSAIRAINVIHYFENVEKINPKKLYYQGYGENKPLVPNTSDANRAKNRRVEINLETKKQNESESFSMQN